MPADIRFSVVIPAWNASRTVVEAVRSCLAQTVPPQEVLVVDNGSTDGTAAVLEAAFGSRIRLIRLPENRGPSGGRNAGMDAATGTHIAFQDADDRWHPRKLERMAAALQEHPRAALLFHRFTLSETDWQAAGDAPVPLRRHPFWKMLLRNAVGTPCAVVRRSGMPVRFDESLRHAEDYDFFLRIASREPVWLLDAPLTLLGRPVLSAGGQSSDRRAMRRGEARAWLKLARARPELAPLLPLLLLWGLLKHLWGTLRRFCGRR